MKHGNEKKNWIEAWFNRQAADREGLIDWTQLRIFRSLLIKRINKLPRSERD